MKGKCFTDANGPEIFKPCAEGWVDPQDFSRYPSTNSSTNGTYKQTYFTMGRCIFNDPPSALNLLCKKFQEKINNLRLFVKLKVNNNWNFFSYMRREGSLNPNDIDEKFISNFLQGDALSRPAETLILPTG